MRIQCVKILFLTVAITVKVAWGAPCRPDGMYSREDKPQNRVSTISPTLNNPQIVSFLTPDSPLNAQLKPIASEVLPRSSLNARAFLPKLNPSTLLPKLKPSTLLPKLKPKIPQRLKSAVGKYIPGRKTSPPPPTKPGLPPLYTPIKPTLWQHAKSLIKTGYIAQPRMKPNPPPFEPLILPPKPTTPAPRVPINRPRPPRKHIPGVTVPPNPS